MSRRTKAWLTVIVAAIAVVALGAYAKSISGAERGSFVMNYPATGAKAGGPSARALTGEVVVPLDSQGFIKRAFQPGVVEVAAHVITNVGATPRRIKFQYAGFKQSVEWHSRDRAWNSKTGEIERDIGPGEVVDFGLMVHLPDPLPAMATPVKGTIFIVDARTGERLSQLPVRFTRTGFAAGSCCE